MKCDKCSNYAPCASGQDVGMARACQGRGFGLNDRPRVIADVMSGKFNVCPSFRKEHECEKNIR